MNILAKYRINQTKSKKYDTILLGAPIWWGVFPTVVNSFLESYNFTGKRIILFATSGGSELGDSKQGLEPSAKGATIINGSILRNDASINTFLSKFVTDFHKQVDL